MHPSLLNSLSLLESGFNVIEYRVVMHYRKTRPLHCPQGQFDPMWWWNGILSLNGIGLQRESLQVSVEAHVWGGVGKAHTLLPILYLPDHLQR